MGRPGLQSSVAPWTGGTRAGAPGASGYAESHWFGNPGNYQALVLSYNDAGTGHFEPPHDPGLITEHSAGRLQAERDYKPEPFTEIPDWLRPARNKTTVNTLTVLGAWTPNYLAAITGVNGDQVRVLRDPRTARKQRKRLRRLHREIDRERTAAIAGERGAAPETSADV